MGFSGSHIHSIDRIILLAGYHAHQTTSIDLGFLFQACTEMVMPICFKGSPTDMFEPQNWNLTVVEKDCQDRWNVTPRPQMADINYGSKNLHASSNIVFR